MTFLAAGQSFDGSPRDQNAPRRRMYSDYRIEKHRATVVLWTIDGDRVAGEVFLQASTSARSGTETVWEMLNGTEPFFPIRCDDGAIRFMAKARVADVHLEAEGRPEEEHVGTRSAMVEVTLAARAPFVGCIYYEVPSARPRLLDYLNRHREHFLRVHTDEGLRLVNRDLISGIRPLD